MFVFSFDYEAKGQFPTVQYEMSLTNDSTCSKFSSYFIEITNDSTIRFSEVFHMSANKTKLINETFLIYNKWNKEYLYINGLDTCLNVNIKKVFNTQSNFERIKNPFNISFHRRLISKRITISICNAKNCRKGKKKLKIEEFNPFFILYMEKKSFLRHAQPVKFDLVFADPLVFDKLKFFVPILSIPFSVPQTFYFNPEVQ